MSDGVVIDANIIPEFYENYKVKNGLVYDVIIWLSNNIGIAITNQIAAEWKQVCSADLFLQWYTNQLKLGNIRNVECTNVPRAIIKKMITTYGFPARSLDIHYIRCAYNTDSVKYIMTYNYDFYDPKCQRSTTHAKTRARECREGSFCRFLLRELRIRVGMPLHCKVDFSIQ
jgi:hypothetical protein